ncbi:hypothetical protein AB0H76_09160 [Nocardia sp. NPDC050712]|uniref:DUF7373 family lipoprotein n=1 Tax=Nocardia sp. NPDC050712 TaxID=3155518 RepID=UPI0033C1B0E8
MRRCNLLWALPTLALVAGCTVAGTPQPQFDDPATFDVGAYSVVPLEAPVNTSERYGRVLESARLAEVLVDPIEVDGALTKAAGANGLAAMPTPAKVTTLLAETVRPVLETNGMLAGAAIGGADVEPGSRGPVVGESRVLTVIVLRFPDAAAATKAAREIDAADAGVSPENVPVTLPEYPAALGHWRPGVPTLAMTLAQDSYVVSLLTGDRSPDLPVLTDLARKAFAAQLSRLRDFVATPRAQLATLPLDPEGLLRRMVPQAPSRWPYPAVIGVSRSVNAGWGVTLQPSGVVLGPRAAQLYIDLPGSVDALAFNGLNVLARFPDAAGARRAFEVLSRKDTEDGRQRVAGPAGLADVRCVLDPAEGITESIRYVCRVLYGRYFVTLFAKEPKNAQQKAAAQYGLLVNGG